MDYLVDKYIKKPEYIKELFKKPVTISLKIDGSAFQISYDKDNDKANTLTITLTHLLKVLQASGLSFSFGTGTNRAVFETQLIIQGSYNESIKS